MEDELVFEARAMLAEVIVDQHLALAEALLDGVLDGDRFFVVSSTLEALASDGSSASEVASAERHLVECARTSSDRALQAAAEAVADTLSGPAREDLEDQWHLAAQMSEVAAAGGEPLLVGTTAPDPSAPAGPVGRLLGVPRRCHGAARASGATRPVGGVRRGSRRTAPRAELRSGLPRTRSSAATGNPARRRTTVQPVDPRRRVGTGRGPPCRSCRDRPPPAAGSPSRREHRRPRRTSCRARLRQSSPDPSSSSSAR